jgi:hypothetical protein
MYRYSTSNVRENCKKVISLCHGDTPDDVDKSFDCGINAILNGGIHWSTAKYQFFGPETLKTTAKRRQYLLSPGEFESAAVLEWHPPPGSSSPGVQPEDEVIEVSPSNCIVASEEGEATLECLGDAKGAIVAANVTQARYPFAGISSVIPSLLVLGRVLVAVGQVDEAQETFRRAQSESHRQKFFFYEALAVHAASECGLAVSSHNFSIREQLAEDPSEYAPDLQ